MAISVARKKWVDDQVATAAGRTEMQFAFAKQETKARRRKEASGQTVTRIFITTKQTEMLCTVEIIHPERYVHRCRSLRDDAV